MTKYRFYEDRKVAVWERIYFSIEAATIETAEAQAAAIAHRSLTLRRATTLRSKSRRAKR